MTVTSGLAAFAVVAGLLTLTPGLDMAFVVRTAVSSGRHSAWGAVLGIQVGVLLWGALAAAGITALLTASQLAYQVLRYAGAAYLVWIGGRMLWESWVARHSENAGPDLEAGRTDPQISRYWRFRTAWKRGFLTNVLNPKIGVFYTALLPQFIPQGVAPLPMGVLLTLVRITEGVLFFAALITFLHALKRALNRPAVKCTLDAVAGTVIIGFGIRVAAHTSD